MCATRPTVLCRFFSTLHVFCHGLQMCLRVVYNTQIISSQFFQEVNLEHVIFAFIEAVPCVCNLSYCLILLDVLVSVKAAPHECIIRTSQP